MIHAQLKRFFHILWDTGNFWGRIFILSLVCWPLLLAAVAATGGNSTLTALLALIPFLTLVLGIAIYPVIDVAVLALEEGRGILKWIAAIIGVELVIGVYFSMVPLSNDSGLAPLLVLVIAAIILLSLSQKLKFIRFILWVTFIVLTLIFVVGGREKAKGLIPKMPGQQDAKQPPAPQGYMEGDLWIDRGSAVVKPKIETKTVRTEMAGGRDVEITTNCREMYEYIATLEPGESIQIRNIDFGPDFPKRNRCSYSANGASIPIYGESGKVTRPRFRHDLPFPDMPHGVMVFLLQDMSGRIIARDYIKEAGGIIYIDNPLPEKVEAHLQYNFMQALLTDKLMKEQIGWDGSTAKFHATRFQAEPWSQ